MKMLIGPWAGRRCATRSRAEARPDIRWRIAIIAIFEYYARVDPVGELQTFKAGFFRALAHPARIRILEILVKGDRSVQELQTALALDSRSSPSIWPCCA